jgi:ribosomal protein L16 Arg81 hydroxylase
MSQENTSKIDLLQLETQNLSDNLKQDFINYRPQTSGLKLDSSKLAKLFPELGENVFQEEYLGKKHYLSKKNSWHSNYGQKDFMDDISSHLFESKHVHYSYSGKPASQSEKTVISGNEIIEKMTQLAEFSFRVAPLFKYSKKSNVLLEKVEFLEGLFGSEVGLITFFSKNNESVIPLHWDTEDLIVCQISGKKTWYLYDNKFKAPLRQQKFGFDNNLCKFDENILEEIILEEGDILYMPKGLGHYAKALAGNSLHLTYGLYHPSLNDVIEYIIKMSMDVFSVSAEARMSFSSHQFHDSDLTNSKERFRQIMDEVSLEYFLKCWPSQYRLFNEERFESVIKGETVEKNKLLRSNVRFHILKSDDGLKLHTYGRLFDIPSDKTNIFHEEIIKQSLDLNILQKNYPDEQVKFFWDFVQKLRIFI